jgi:ABC-type polysaccharide/polyol phosphate transport system ATPase subunit
MRLGFSVAVHLQPDILLADEILAVGDQPFQEKCHAKIAELRTQGMTLILVSHSTQQVQRFCDKFVRLEYGQLVEAGAVKKKLPDVGMPSANGEF